MSCSLNSVRGVSRVIIEESIKGDTGGDIRSLDYSLCRAWKVQLGLEVRFSIVRSTVDLPSSRSLSWFVS